MQGRSRTILRQQQQNVVARHVRSLQTHRGFRDMDPETTCWYRLVEQQCKSTSEAYIYDEMRTPLLEPIELFRRGLGSDSDIVSKEMFHFWDGPQRKKVHVALRPEGTASIARYLCNNTSAAQKTSRAWYCDTMYRRERPQRGRYREFTQFGVELTGPGELQDAVGADVEIISMATDVLAKLHLQDSTKLLLNAIGDAEARAKYAKAMRSYLEPHKQNLSALSLERFERNAILRILDSNDPQDRHLVRHAGDAPRLEEFIGSEARSRFRQVCLELDTLGIDYEHDPFLVRGLDYYSDTTFEFVTHGGGVENDDSTDHRQQNAVLAGGRYDPLFHTLGAKESSSIQGCGWAAGIDRLVLEVQDQFPSLQAFAKHCQARSESSSSSSRIYLPEHVYVAVLTAETPDAQRLAAALTRQLRQQGLRTSLEPPGAFGTRLRKVLKKRSPAYVVFVGQEEVKQQRVSVKAIASGDQIDVSVDDLFSHISRQSERE